MKYPVYPAYKPSGFEWLRDIPEHWQVMRTKFACHINPPKSALSALPDDLEVSFLPMEKIGEDARLVLDETRSLGQLWQGYTYFRNEDVILAKITPCFENGKGALCRDLLNGVGFGTTELHVLRASRLVDSRFIIYVTQSHHLRHLGVAAMYGAAGQQRVPESFVKNIALTIPPLPEQRAIATFLDRETAKIDTLLAKKERLIGLLQEKRTAVVSHAVTRGLDADVPLNNSGVEWLGNIPAHWKLMLLKRFATIRYGLGQPPPEVLDGVPLVRATNLKGGKIVREGMIYIDPADVPDARDAFLAEGEIIVVRSGAYTGDSALVPAEYSGSVAGYDMVVTVKRGFSPYFAWQTLSQEVRDLQFGFESLRAAQPHLNAEELGGIVVLVPPGDEQRAIAMYLDRETAKIDALIAKVGQAIETLKEYRIALISAAVTGKIDVRETFEVSETSKV